MSRGIPKEGKSETDEIIKRLKSHPGIYGIIISNKEGIPIRTTLDNSTTVHYCGLIQKLLHKSIKAVTDLEPTNELTLLRMRSKKYEIIVSPKRDLRLIVIQRADFDEATVKVK